MLACGHLARTTIHFSAEIRQAVRIDYEQVLEEFPRDLAWKTARRERAAAVADFLAAWIAPGFDSSKEGNVWRLEIQRQYWNLALWLDADVLQELNRALEHSAGGNHFEALAKVRKLLLNDPDDPISGDDLIRWPAQPEAR